MNSNTLMILLFPVLDFLPFGIPRYLLFKEKLRFPLRHVFYLLLALSLINCVAFYLVHRESGLPAGYSVTLMRYGFLLLHVTLSFLLIRDSLAKNMFTFLLMVSYSFFVFGNANFLEARWFWSFSVRHPYLIYNVARILLLCLTYPFFLHFLRHTVRSALAIEDAAVWRYIWKIPLFSTLFGVLYCTVDDVYAPATWQFLASRYLMLLGSCYISFVLLKLLEISRRETHLEEALRCADMSLTAQQKQYGTLTAYMEEARRARHDLRQHLTVLDNFIERDDKEGLQDYVSRYRATLPLDTHEVYCRNSVVNAIVCCYGDIARKQGIAFEAAVGYPEPCPLADTDAAVLFGNLLENAVEASCGQKSGKRFIRLTVKQAGGGIVIVLDNSYSGLVLEGSKVFPSSKRNGPGVGITSIREIAARYGGYTEFCGDGNVFSASVFLNPIAENVGNEGIN